MCQRHLQVQLSHLLTSAQPDKSVSRLIERILSTIKHPNCELALALIRALRCIGRFSDALCVLENCVEARLEKCDTASIPSFDFQKAKTLQSIGFGSMQYFSSGLSGFEAQLGADNITTQTCRYELALHHARSGDNTISQAIPADLAKSIGGKTVRTKKENRLFRELGRVRLPTSASTSGSKTQKGLQMLLSLNHLHQRSVLRNCGTWSYHFGWAYLLEWLHQSSATLSSPISTQTE